MALGRIKRSRAKVRMATRLKGGRDTRSVGVTTWIARRSSGAYDGTACLRSAGRVNPKPLVQRDRCVYVSGRTPQSALGKALKALGQKVALRGRR